MGVSLGGKPNRYVNFPGVGPNSTAGLHEP